MHIVVGLLIAFVIVVLYARQTRATRRCRWRQETSGNDGPKNKYRCASCGAVAFTDHGGPPRHCELAKHGL